MSFERVLRWALVSIAIVGLATGIIAYVAGRPGLADLCWTLATAPVVAGLAVSIVRDFLAGRFGVDAVALVSMSAALVLGQPLAVAVGDQLLVRAGEVVPVDGVVTSESVTIDESALTGEPIPVVKSKGAAIFSGSLNSGETFEMTASSMAGESTYA